MNPFHKIRPILILGVLVALGSLGFAGVANAAVQELCLRYPVETVDSGLGVDYEDYYAENDAVWPYWKSRGAAYQVLDPDSLDRDPAGLHQQRQRLLRPRRERYSGG